MLSSDSHQFHQYQQNEQSSLILTELTEHKKTAKCDLGNPGSGLGQAQQCGGVKPINGIPPLDSWISNSACFMCFKCNTPHISVLWWQSVISYRLENNYQAVY